MSQQFGSQGLVIVAPSLDAETRVKAFKEKHSIDYPLLAGARKAAQSYGVKAYPTMFLVGKDGKILWKGHFPDADLTKAIGAALGGK